MNGRVFGITGWKNSGKTTLTEKLVSELVRRGRVVSTVKQAVVSGNRWALMHELRDEEEPALEAILSRLAPCDIVLVEGYKREAHKKIEARRIEAKDRAPLSAQDPNIVAIAADHAVEGESLPVFDLDDVKSIADFIERITGLSG